MTLDEVRPKSEPLDPEKLTALVKGSKVDFLLVNGTTRRWTHNEDGTFIASSSNRNGRNATARGTWKVSDAGEYCLTFDWGMEQTESWCRVMYPVEDRYYGFGLKAEGTTKSGQYYFKK